MNETTSNHSAAQTKSDKPTVLSCQGLSKSYHQADHELVVLNKVDFEIHAGEQVAIAGTSGSGKTTLLNLLGGIDQATAGKVIISGKDISSLSSTEQDKLRNQTLGFVYQFHHLLGEFTALENVAMPLIIARLDFNESMEKAKLLLEQVGLGDRLSHKPSALSGGERQRVAIARALINNPVCVLMDEPTGNLDRQTAESIHALMQALKQSLETSFIIVTHDSNLARKMDRVLLLEDAKLKNIPQSKEESEPQF